MHDENSIFDAFKTCSSAAVDSRNVTLGTLFFALKGAKVDGHDYIKECANQGAKAAVVSSEYQGDSFGLTLYRVKDPLTSLQTLAFNVQKNRKAKIIGVTGSYGKTTTKEFIVQILQKKFKVGFSPGNSNSQVGIPLTLLNHIEGDEEILVLEMSMTEKGHIKKLVNIAPPQISVITAVELVHAEGFSSLGDIAEAKGEILLSPSLSIAFIHEKLKRFEFSASNKVHYDQSHALGAYHLPQHLRENLGAACCIAKHLGMSEQDIFDATNTIKTVERRFEISTKNGIQIINDGYNASAMLTAVQNLPKAPSEKGKTVAVLGEILGLGKFSRECHEKVAQEAIKKIDHLFLVGEGCQPILQLFKDRGVPATLYQDREKLFQDLKTVLCPGDLLFLKGSRHWQLSELGDQL